MKITLYPDAAGDTRWRITARNGRIVADGGQGYSDIRDAIHGLELVTSRKIERDRNGDWTVEGLVTEWSDDGPLRTDEGDWTLVVQESETDEVLEEPPVGSLVRDKEDDVWKHVDEQGWSIPTASGSVGTHRAEWSAIWDAYGPLVPLIPASAVDDLDDDEEEDVDDRPRQDIPVRVWRHTRKGIVRGRLIRHSGAWLTIELVDAVSGVRNAWSPGETITVRESFVSELVDQ